MTDKYVYLTALWDLCLGVYLAIWICTLPIQAVVWAVENF